MGVMLKCLVVGVKVAGLSHGFECLRFFTVPLFFENPFKYYFLCFWDFVFLVPTLDFQDPQKKYKEFVRKVFFCTSEHCIFRFIKKSKNNLWRKFCFYIWKTKKIKFWSWRSARNNFWPKSRQKIFFQSRSKKSKF